MAFLHPVRGRALWPWLALLLGVGATLACWVVVRRAERVRTQGTFQAAAAARIALIEQRLVTEEQILRGAAAFAAHQKPLTRSAWRDYVSALDLPTRHPGIRGLGFAQWIPREAVAAHERQARFDGFPDYRVKSFDGRSSDGETLGTVIFLEPLDDRNLRVLGLDVWSEPVRREAMARARDLGVVAATRRVQLVQDDPGDRQAGVILYAPVYRLGAPLATVADRRRALLGWTTLPLRMDDHLQGILGAQPEGLQVQVQDEGTSPASELYPSNPVLVAELQKAWQGTRLTRSRILDVAGRRWRVQVHVDGRFTTSRGEGAHWSLLLGGIFSSVLASLALAAVGRSEARAERLAERRLEALATSEARYTAVVESLSEGLLVCGPDGRIQACNPAALAILGLAREDLIGARLGAPGWRMVDEAGVTMTHHQHPVAVALRTGEPQTRAIFGLHSPGGRFRWLQCSATPILRQTDASTHSVVATVLDITDQRHSEVALRESEARWKFAIEGAGDGLWDWDAQTDRVFFSSRWKSMLGYADGDITDSLSEWETRVHPEDLPAVREALRRHLLGETAVYQSEHRLRCKQGDYKWILDRGMVVQWTEAGQPARLIGTHTDLTDRRNAEAAQRDAHKAESLALMASGIAHDFNNLFQSLLGNLELAHLRADASGRQVIDRARNALDKASGLSRRLLDFSGGSFTHWETLSVNGLIQGVAEACPPQDTPRIRLELDSRVPEVVADSQQIRQVVEILLENALEAQGPKGGAVTLASEWLPELPDSERAQGRWMGEVAPGPLVRIAVADTGGGAGPEVMSRLFDPFFSTKGLGRGLGLPSALGLIRGNRAALQVMDQPGVGMSFRIYLPADRRMAQRRSGPEIRADRQAVLVVDDEPELRLVLTEALHECHGCEVFEAADGIEAIEVFQAHQEEIGLVLMDSVMPRMKGPEAFDEIRRIRPGVPGILISGFSEGKGQDLAQKHGFSAFLKKPFPLKHLIEVMTEVKASGGTDGESGGTYA